MDKSIFNIRAMLAFLTLFIFVCGMASTASATKTTVIDKSSGSIHMGSYDINKTCFAYKTGENYVKVVNTQRTKSPYGVSTDITYLILKKTSATNLKISYTSGSSTAVKYVKTKLTATQYYWMKKHELQKKGSHDCYWNIHQ